MYNKEEQAIKFVIKAFEDKKRIKENINIAFHSITVGFMLKNCGCNEEIVITGLLHDIIEDSDYDYNYLLDNYGETIANNVSAISEDKNIKDWRLRKETFIKKIAELNDDIILIEVADKLHNLLSNYELWQKEGKDAIATLDISYEDNKWYYLEMQKLFNNRLKNTPLLERYNEICKLYFEQ